MLTGGAFGDEVWAADIGTAPAVAALCLKESSEVEGLRLDVELREARWPGVWLRGMGGIDSVEMSLERGAEAEAEALSEGDDEEIFWERMVLARSGDARRSMMSADLAAWSAMVDGDRSGSRRPYHVRQTGLGIRAAEEVLQNADRQQHGLRAQGGSRGAVEERRRESVCGSFASSRSGQGSSLAHAHTHTRIPHHTPPPHTTHSATATSAAVPAPDHRASICPMRPAWQGAGEKKMQRHHFPTLLRLHKTC